jgi:hypothetical protein
MRRNLVLWTASCAACVAVLGVTAISCSVGEATSPACDPNAAPGAANACYAIAPCDDGTGYPKQEVGCCSQYGANIYEALGGAEIVDPVACFLTVCPYPDAGTPPTPGCPAAQLPDAKCGSITVENSALAGYELCMTGRLGDHDAGTGGSGNAGTGGTGVGGGNGGAGG